MPAAWLSRIADGINVSVAFATRIPLANVGLTSGADVVRASWALPIVGVLVGGLGALTYWTAHLLGLTAASCAALTLAATLAATGCLHEDGLADTADGFGAGASRERKLEIMHDSRIGAYGSCALIVSILLRWSAVASLGDALHVTAALIAAHVAARGTLPAFMRLVPRARRDGLSAGAGAPTRATASIAACLGLLALGLTLGTVPALVAVSLIGLAGVLMGWLCIRQIGGQTGDVLGALEQVCEILILLTASAQSRAAI